MSMHTYVVIDYLSRTQNVMCCACVRRLMLAAFISRCQNSVPTRCTSLCRSLRRIDMDYGLHQPEHATYPISCIVHPVYTCWMAAGSNDM